MTNTNIQITELAPQGGITQKGYKLGYILAGAKAAQNDTWTVIGAEKVILCWPTVDATGAWANHTIATNVITFTSTTNTAHSALILYKGL